MPIMAYPTDSPALAMVMFQLKADHSSAATWTIARASSVENRAWPDIIAMVRD